jgi:hypothetical protein
MNLYKKKPKETSPVLKELLETVCLLKVVKDPMPATSNKRKWKLTSRNSLFSLSAMVALVVICITTNVIFPFQNNNVVQAMSKTYEKAKSCTIVEVTPAGNSLLEELPTFVKVLAGLGVDLPETIIADKPKVIVPVDLEAERNDQKSVDAGHSPWRLDPIFVSQVFVSLKLSPQGIIGDYPIKTADLKISVNNGKEAVVEVSGSKTPIKKVYLKRLVRPDSTGIWTVVGYDPK